MRELALNRPVHLAGRDAYYEQAVKLLRGDLMNYEVIDRVERCGTVIRYMQFACEHAAFALRGIEADGDERRFMQFLELVLNSAHALQVMSMHENLLMSDRELLREFLSQDAESIDRSAAEHRQLAFNLIKETIQLIQMADPTFQKLKEGNRTELARDDSASRYQRAYDSFLKQGR